MRDYSSINYEELDFAIMNYLTEFTFDGNATKEQLVNAVVGSYPTFDKNTVICEIDYLIAHNELCYNNGLVSI